MGNLITDKLSRSLNVGLMDLAQMSGIISYDDIIKFGEKSNKKEQRKVSELLENWQEVSEVGDEREINNIEQKIKIIINKQ